MRSSNDLLVFLIHFAFFIGSNSAQDATDTQETGTGTQAESTVISTTRVTNFGPLTTRFRPTNSDCYYPDIVSVETSTYANGTTMFYTEARVGCGYKQSCCPPGYKSDKSVTGYWSPGICPSGYREVSWRVIEATVTQGICCPGYAPFPVPFGVEVDYDPENGCQITIIDGTGVTFMNSRSDGNLEIFVGVSSTVIKASALSIQYAASDSFPAHDDVETTASSSPIETENAVDFESYDEKPKVSGGAIVGIVFGSLFGVIILPIVGFCCWICCCDPCRKRKGRIDSLEQQTIAPDDDGVVGNGHNTSGRIRPWMPIHTFASTMTNGNISDGRDYNTRPENTTSDGKVLGVYETTEKVRRDSNRIINSVLPKDVQLRLYMRMGVAYPKDLLPELTALQRIDLDDDGMVHHPPANAVEPVAGVPLYVETEEQASPGIEEQISPVDVVAVSPTDSMKKEGMRIGEVYERGTRYTETIGPRR